MPITLRICTPFSINKLRLKEKTISSLSEFKKLVLERIKVPDGYEILTDDPSSLRVSFSRDLTKTAYDASVPDETIPLKPFKNGQRVYVNLPYIEKKEEDESKDDSVTKEDDTREEDGTTKDNDDEAEEVDDEKEEQLAIAMSKGFESIQAYREDFVKRGVLSLTLIGPENGRVQRNMEISENATCEDLLKLIQRRLKLDSINNYDVVKASIPYETKLFRKFPKMRLLHERGPELSREDTIMITPIEEKNNLGPSHSISDSKIVDMDALRRSRDAHFRIQGNMRSHILGVHFDDRHSSFIYQDHTRRRVGYLYGTVHEDGENVGWVDVEAVYEPPQIGFRHRCLELKDRHREDVDVVMKALNLRLVGWIFSHRYRKRPIDEKENLLRHQVSSLDRTPPLQSAEILRAAELQKRHGDHFVTLVLTKDFDKKTNSEYFSLEAWQVSQQCVKLLDDLEIDLADSYKIRSKRQVRAPKRNESGLFLTNSVDCDFFATYTAIKRHVPTMRQIGGFPVTNRGTVLSFDHVRSIFLQPHDRFLELVQDVNALLFLCRYRKFFEISMNEIKILCSAVREEKEDSVEQFRSRIEARLGIGFRCPLCFAKGILTGGYDVSGIRRHVSAAHARDVTPVRCPILQWRDFGKSAYVRPPYVDHLNNLLNEHGDTIQSEISVNVCRACWVSREDEEEEQGEEEEEEDIDMSMSEDEKEESGDEKLEDEEKKNERRIQVQERIGLNTSSATRTLISMGFESQASARAARECKEDIANSVVLLGEAQELQREFEDSELDSALLCLIENGRKLYMARKDMEKLMRLRSMGFQDDERSVRLLREHNGDLARVVNRLMTS